MLGTRFIAMCTGLGLLLLANGQPTHPREGGREHGQGMEEKRRNRTAQHNEERPNQWICSCNLNATANETARWSRSFDQPVSDFKGERKSCMCNSVSGFWVSMKSPGHSKGLNGTRGRGGSKGPIDKEGRKFGAEETRGGKGKGKKKRYESGTDSVHDGTGRKGDEDERETRGGKGKGKKQHHESGTDSVHGSRGHKGDEDEHESGTATLHGAHEQAGQQTTTLEIAIIGQQSRHGESHQRHHGQSSSGVSGNARDSNLGGAAGKGEEEKIAEEDETGPSSSNIFIGSSVAGGVLVALVMAACWRCRTSSRRSDSKHKDIQLDAATTIVVGCTSPNASVKNNAQPLQEGSIVVVGVPIESNADLELGMGKPTQK